MNMQYQFVTTPVGLASAPASQCRYIQLILTKIPENWVQAYLDDVIIFGRDSDQSLQRLRCVLQRFKEAKLTFFPEKCDLLVSETTFLGFRLNKDGLKPHPDKIKAMLELPRPVNIKTLRSALGQFNFIGDSFTITVLLLNH